MADYEHLYRKLYARVQYHNGMCEAMCKLRSASNGCVPKNELGECKDCPREWLIDDEDMLIP
jgi:hypothetical protein